MPEQRGRVDAPADEPTWPELLHRLIGRSDLSAAQTSWAMDRIMSGEASAVQVAGFLVALRAKGESVEEMTGLVAAMLDHALRIEVPGPCVDVVGTGGDRAHTVNISTMAALVVAGAGARVVKHGNRAASSACGSADVLEALGVRLDLKPAQVAEVAVRAGITFCFAQVFHPSFRHAAPARAGLAVPTAFNFLGPLTNPAQPRAAAVGVADRRMAPIVAGVLAARGTSALVFRGEDGLDELTTSGPSTIWEVRDGSVVEQLLDPGDLGVPRSPIELLRGGDAAFNADVVRRLLGGEPGPVRDAVLLNAASALVAADAADDAPTPGGGTGGLVERLGHALARAAQSVDSGSAAQALDRWVAATASA
ncbi:anthranilate phosphoribosyltransferase [Angustibacter sp. McL0619]|uniref:anthranilate phosphoribosyltransferase n=1 Tax=Angustibacter sp. McL0619 TaxID=3415676 RepID=UPI003CFAA37A